MRQVMVPPCPKIVHLDTADRSARISRMLYMPGSVGFPVTDAVLFMHYTECALALASSQTQCLRLCKCCDCLRSAWLTTARMRLDCRLFWQLIITTTIWMSMAVITGNPVACWRSHLWCDKCCDCCQYSFGIATMI